MKSIQLPAATTIVITSLVAGGWFGCNQTPQASIPFDVVEATIPDMQAAMESGQITSRHLIAEHLTRIARYEWKLNAAVSINPNAQRATQTLD